MFKNFFKAEKPQVSVSSADDKSFKINDYYGRFTLDDIDREVDSVKLEKLREEVRLDYKNNQATFEQNGNIKTKKHMNFCRFMLARIEQRIKEIERLEAANNRLITLVNKNPEKRWKAIVEHIVQLYPGINLQEIISKIESGGFR
ncbi:hypothetical protein [Sphingobacterium thalpophilum]|uniref:hypothetical protein n=1 Tax=Sphingobacterium thalpophilum TaxID=259 RepID=UPI003D963369